MKPNDSREKAILNSDCASKMTKEISSRMRERILAEHIKIDSVIMKRVKKYARLDFFESMNAILSGLIICFAILSSPLLN